MKKFYAVVFLASFAAACGGNSSMSPSAPTVPMSVTGAWAGIGSASGSAMGPGAMMGQADMGTMTWQLTQSDTMAFTMDRFDSC